MFSATDAWYVITDNLKNYLAANLASALCPSSVEVIIAIYKESQDRLVWI